ncbi:hypothetical protein [Roseofilum casamattae]|uniref:Uncharacterized protein n=1 Tax=Roseofilum casamattae BLCC-M143 TaxID=3022442 RepID=A0ABT7BU41_9CYAN|nr:hypothetical protein [Roseofilum casamattae]MDJ1182016.1 hypothetical protein [Roseofilum casamattae BLCC-M143]
MFAKSCSYSLVTLLALLWIGLDAQASRGQASSIDPLADIQTQDGGSGIFSGRSGPGQFFDLMHNLQRGQHLINVEELNRDRQESLDNAAAEFRKQQLELLNTAPSSPEPAAENRQ